MSRSRIALLFILLLSLFLNVSNNDFSIRYHGDEALKLQFIDTDTQNFKHPILLLQAARLVNQVLQISDPLTLAILGRTLSALAGTLAVLITYFISKKGLGTKPALMVALLLALSPILVIHAHYVKEDLCLLLFLMLSIKCLLDFCARPYKKELILLGLAVGCALSSKYVGFFLLPILLLTPFLLQKKGLYKKLFYAIAIALGLFCLINYPLFWQINTFLSGLSLELDHAVNGHYVVGTPGTYTEVVRIPGHTYYLGFHFVYSLIPGMGLTLALLSLLALLLRYIAPYGVPHKEEKLFILVIAVYYFSAELSPMKTFPDLSRYMLPIVPFLLYFTVKLLASWKKIGIVVFAFLAAYSLWDSAHLVYYINKDTREEARAWMLAHPGEFRGDYYATQRGEGAVKSLVFLDLEKERKEGVRYLLTTNFMYDRIYITHAIEGAKDCIQRSFERYEVLFAFPYTEIKPAYRSFAFSNPTIRIINICCENANKPGHSLEKAENLEGSLF